MYGLGWGSHEDHHWQHSQITVGLKQSLGPNPGQLKPNLMGPGHLQVVKWPLP